MDTRRPAGRRGGAGRNASSGRQGWPRWRSAPFVGRSPSVGGHSAIDGQPAVHSGAAAIGRGVAVVRGVAAVIGRGAAVLRGVSAVIGGAAAVPGVVGATDASPCRLGCWGPRSFIAGGSGRRPATDGWQRHGQPAGHPDGYGGGLWGPPRHRGGRSGWAAGHHVWRGGSPRDGRGDGPR